jgi:cytochrome c553
MWRWSPALLAFGVVCAVAAHPAAGGKLKADWAFGSDKPAAANVADDAVVRVPESDVALRRGTLKDFFVAADWFVADHPTMPALVAHGARPGVFACGYCHLPNGAGRPENAMLAGLPEAYIMRQVRAFADGSRRAASAAHGPTMRMIGVARAAIGDPGLAEAAAYFARLKPVRRLRVVESETIPRMVVSRWVYHEAAGNGVEALGARVVETPDDFSLFEALDSRVTYTAYVPVGTLRLGEALVRHGVPTCTACHGEDLRGMGVAPPLAGRSPSYLARQLVGFRMGARRGVMVGVVAGMQEEDVVRITGYLASLRP